MSTTALDLKSIIRDVPDFPKPGVIFKDITPVLMDENAFRQAVEAMASPFRDKGVTRVVCVEARGYIFGAAIALLLYAGFIPVRKKGKLPRETYEASYDLEYGQDTLTVHKDALQDKDRVLIVDDLLATGGTIAATLELLGNFKAEVEGIAFLVELKFLNGRQKLPGRNIHSVLQY